MTMCIHGTSIDERCFICDVGRDERQEAPVPTAEVRVFNGVTRHNLDPNRVLDAARNAQLKNLTIIGYDSEGEFYFASTEAGGPSVLWDLMKAAQKLMEAGE